MPLFPELVYKLSFMPARVTQWHPISKQIKISRKLEKMWYLSELGLFWSMVSLILPIFLQMTNFICLRWMEYPCACIPHFLCSQTPRLVCILATVASATVGMGVMYLCGKLLLIPFGIYSGVVQQDHMVVLFLVAFLKKGIPKFISIVAELT